MEKVYFITFFQKSDTVKFLTKILKAKFNEKLLVIQILQPI